MKAQIKVTQVKSLIGQSEEMRVTMNGLGLRRPGNTVTVKNTPSFRGAIKKVIHLVKFEEI